MKMSAEREREGRKGRGGGDAGEDAGGEGRRGISPERRMSGARR
jgi:hypothetical protein